MVLKRTIKGVYRVPFTLPFGGHLQYSLPNSMKCFSVSYEAPLNLLTNVKYAVLKLESN